MAVVKGRRGKTPGKRNKEEKEKFVAGIRACRGEVVAVARGSVAR